MVGFVSKPRHAALVLCSGCYCVGKEVGTWEKVRTEGKEERDKSIMNTIATSSSIIVIII